jgi:hypothetical protein
MNTLLVPSLDRNDITHDVLHYVAEKLKPRHGKQVSDPKVPENAYGNPIWQAATIGLAMHVEKPQTTSWVFDQKIFHNLERSVAQRAIAVLLKTYLGKVAMRPSMTWADPKYNGAAIAGIAHFDPNGNPFVVVVDDLIYSYANTLVVAVDETLHPTHRNHNRSATILEGLLSGNAAGHDLTGRNYDHFSHPGFGLSGYVNRTMQVVSMTRTMQDYNHVNTLYSLINTICTNMQVPDHEAQLWEAAA